MKPLRSRVVITGASSGIGAATAVAFARQGSHLVLGARGREGLEDIARRCRAAGGTAEVRVVDVTDAAAVAAFAAEARGLLGGIDLWFSDAGIGVIGRFHEAPVADHRQVVETNLIGHINDAHAVLPIFLAQGHGIWVNLISAGGLVAVPFAAAYSASKFGLVGFSQALRAEVSHHRHIFVCDVYPTAVDTPGVHHAANYTGAKLSYPPGVMAPEEVAKAVVRLARRPRATTVVGAPAVALKLIQFLAPDLGASLMNRFMESWSSHAAPAENTTGALYEPPREASGISAGQRRPDQRSNVKLVAAVAIGVALTGVLLFRRQSSSI